MYDFEIRSSGTDKLIRSEVKKKIRAIGGEGWRRGRGVVIVQHDFHTSI